MRYFKEYYHATINHIDVKMNYNGNAIWLYNMEEDFCATEDIRSEVRQMVNWRAAVPDYVQEFWFKRMTPKIAPRRSPIW